MTRQIPLELKERQDKDRRSSVEKVQKAIDELKDEGFVVTTKLLMERTGLARSTFSKEHIKEVLKENKVCRFTETKTISRALNDKERINQLEDENLVLTRKVTQLDKQLTDNMNKVNQLKVELNETKEVNKKLRGQLHILLQNANLKGINIEA